MKKLGFASLLLLIMIEIALAQGEPTAAVSAKEFFHRIDWKSIPKSAFESLADYTNRINSAFDISGKKVWLQIPNSDAVFSYNAEDKKAIYGLRPGPSCFWVCTSNVMSYQTTNENAFGAMAEVDNSVSKIGQFDFTNSKHFPKSIFSPVQGIGIGVIFPIDGQVAKELTIHGNMQLNILVEVGKMTGAKVYDEATTATFEFRHSSFTRYFQIPATLLAMKVIDSRSNSVLGEWSSK